ncbi:MAG: metal-dependent transcriptional regulator [Theionarchaea archaeon]|nr:metal-dependent transcriptional regulator [Theionarchaea archaeon]
MKVLSRKAEDYLEAILNITERKGYARIKDIAHELGITPPSVTEMVSKLDKKKLVLYEKYGGVRLTEKGRDIASTVKRRHETFNKFLKIILVPTEIAEKDACILEHHLNSKTIKQFSQFLQFIENEPSYSQFIHQFEKFCEREASSHY